MAQSLIKKLNKTERIEMIQKKIKKFEFHISQQPGKCTKAQIFLNILERKST